MPRLTSDLSSTVAAQAMPKHVATGRIETITATKGKNAPFNPYLDTAWLVTGDKDGNPYEFSGRKILFVSVMTGGTTKKGDLMPLFQLAKLLEKGRVPWTCLVCHPEVKANANYEGEFDRACEFKKGTGENGMPKGSMCCPDCEKPFEASYDTNAFIGVPYRIAIDVEPGLEGKPERNKIVDWLGASE